MGAIEDLVEIEAIKNVRNLYSHYYDGQKVDELVDLFTEDAVCEFGPMFGGDWVGREAIRKNFDKWIRREGQPYGVLHALTNPWIRLIDAETAHGRWYLLDLRTSEGVENPLILFGIYDDVYRKQNECWRIHRTRIDFLWPRRDVSPPREI